MRVIKYTVKTNFTVCDVLFLKGDTVFISESYYVMNGTFRYARKVFDIHKKYLGMIKDEYFDEDIKKWIET